MSRRQARLAAILAFVFIAVLGVVYMQVSLSARAYRTGWVATREVLAGETLSAANVHEVHVPDVGDAISMLQGAPFGRRVGHRLSERDLVRNDDLVPRDAALVPISIRTGSVAGGDVVDIYASLGGRVVLVARGLTLVSPGTALVPASDEAFWVALAASPTNLIAAHSTGLDVLVGSSGVSTDDAIRHLVDVAGAPQAAGSQAQNGASH